jgi:hypothetical protein
MGARHPCREVSRPLRHVLGLVGWAVACRRGGRHPRSRGVARGAWDERPPGRHTVPQRFDGAGTREGEAATVLGLCDLGRHLAAGEEPRRGWGVGARGRWQRLGAAGMRQGRGGTRPQESPGVGQEGRGGGAGAVAGTLDGRALVCARPTGAGDVLVPAWRRGGRHGGADTAGGAPAASTAAVRSPRQAWGQAAAASAHAVDRRLRAGGRA